MHCKGKGNVAGRVDFGDVKMKLIIDLTWVRSVSCYVTRLSMLIIVCSRNLNAVFCRPH